MAAFVPVLLAFIVVMAAFFVARRYTGARKAAREAPPEDARLELAAEKEGDGAFVLRSENGGALRLRLGEAKRSAGPAPVAFGGGSIESLGREPGLAFVADVAAWLGADTPAPRATPGTLAPARLGFVELAADAGMTRYKLILHDAAEAELLLDLTHDGRRAWLGEKDEAYRESILAGLARALVDGEDAGPR
jgi:hypothetical protein